MAYASCVLLIYTFFLPCLGGRTLISNKSGTDVYGVLVLYIIYFLIRWDHLSGWDFFFCFEGGRGELVSNVSHPIPTYSLNTPPLSSISLAR